MTNLPDLPRVIEDTIDQLVANFLYYDRKEDDELPRGDIEKFVRDNDGACCLISGYFSQQFHSAVRNQT